MLYLIRIRDEGAREQTLYHILETHTASVISGTAEFIGKLIDKYKIKAVNFHIDKGQLKINQWPHGIPNSLDTDDGPTANHILLTNQNSQRFKVATSKGTVRFYEPNELKVLIRQSKLANCSFTSDKNPVYMSIDVYKYQNDIKLEEYIDRKYKEFRAKTLLIGLDMGFDYIIEEKDVTLIEYTGTSKRVVLPNFVTAINKRVFMNKDIVEISMSEGLKYIGNEAFISNKISQVVVPRSIVFIGKGAFHHNAGLLSGRGTYDKNSVKGLNSEALVMDNYIRETTM